MNFKKAGGKIFGVALNKAEQRALDQEIKKQIVENDTQFSIDNDSSILWMLHVHFGFGPQAFEEGVEAVLCRKYQIAGSLPDGC